MSESRLNSRDVSFRTVFHDVEGIKAYLRRMNKEHEILINGIQSIVCDQVKDAFSSLVGLSSMIISTVEDRIEDFVSPLRTEWVNNEFSDYIASSTNDNTINVISNAFMSIVEYNSENFNAYINNAIDTDNTINVISNAFMSIVEYNSENFNAYINNALTTNSIEAFISPLQTAWISTGFMGYIADNIEWNSGGFMTQDIQQIIANQFPEVDIKYTLKDYHLIEKHYTTLTSNVAIDISGLTNPATAIERFRILAYTKDDKSTSELNYTYTGSAIIEDAYALVESNLLTTSITIANMNLNGDDLSISFTSSDAVVNAYMGGTLWYGFTDLVEPDTNTNYTVMISIDCSPNYLQLLTSAGGRFTVGYNERLGYISDAAESIRSQFGSNIDVVEVVPHPLLVNDSERYIVLRAITNSTKKGYWEYRTNDQDNIDSYFYNKTYDRSVLKFSPLETPIMYVNKKTGETTTNYYIWKLYQVFNNRTDLYSIDLSNFVPWTTILPSGLDGIMFNNINTGSPNFGKLDVGEMCNGCANLASIDLRCIDSLVDKGLLNTATAFTDCGNLRTVYCNESVKELISSALPEITSHTWNYITGISAWVSTNQ